MSDPRIERLAAHYANDRVVQSSGLGSIDLVGTATNVLAHCEAAGLVVLLAEDVCPNPNNCPVHAPGQWPRDCQACLDKARAGR